MALMRFTDVMMSFPIILFAAFLAVVFRPGMAVLTFIIGFVSWFYLAPIVRGEILSVKNREYVEAARSIGVGRSVILVRHLLPQVYGQIFFSSSQYIRHWGRYVSINAWKQSVCFPSPICRSPSIVSRSPS